MRCRLLSVPLAFTLILAGSVANQVPLDLAAPPVAAESIRGDVDGNGTVNSIDAFLLLQFSAEVFGLGSPYREKHDVNHDQHVDALDALYILQFHAGLLTSLNGAAQARRAR